MTLICVMNQIIFMQGEIYNFMINVFVCTEEDVAIRKDVYGHKKHQFMSDMN